MPKEGCDRAYLTKQTLSGADGGLCKGGPGMDQAEGDAWLEGARADGEKTCVRKDAERSQG